MPAPKNPTPKSFPPMVYVERAFWRFFLDVAPGASTPDAPRFRHFAENFRNYAVSGAIIKAGQLTKMSLNGTPGRHPVSEIRVNILSTLGWTTAVLASIQLFGLILTAMHWYWGVDSRSLRPAGKDDGIRGAAFVLIALAGPVVLVWAMFIFVQR